MSPALVEPGGSSVLSTSAATAGTTMFASRRAAVASWLFILNPGFSPDSALRSPTVSCGSVLDSGPLSAALRL